MKGVRMQNSGDSEFSTEANNDSRKLTLSFWQSFLLTLSGVAGLISLVLDGPRWITYTGFVIVIVLLLSVIYSQRKKTKK